MSPSLNLETGFFAPSVIKYETEGVKFIVQYIIKNSFLTIAPSFNMASYYHPAVMTTPWSSKYVAPWYSSRLSLYDPRGSLPCPPLRQARLRGRVSASSCMSPCVRACTLYSTGTSPCAMPILCAPLRQTLVWGHVPCPPLGRSRAHGRVPCLSSSKTILESAFNSIR